MTKNELCDIAKEVNKNIDIIRNEQAEYLRGMERGIDLMFTAVRNYLAKEETSQTKKGGSE